MRNWQVIGIDADGLDYECNGWNLTEAEARKIADRDQEYAVTNETEKQLRQYVGSFDLRVALFQIQKAA